jgi:hypothetical protein
VEGVEDFEGDIRNCRKRRLTRDGNCIYIMFRVILNRKTNFISFSLSLVMLRR